MDITAVAEKVAQVFREEANVRAVFGEPIKLDTRTIVPVAIVVVSFGGGLGESRVGGGAGGGGELRALPFGFIHEDGKGEVRFTQLDAAHALEPHGGKALLARVRERIGELA